MAPLAWLRRFFRWLFAEPIPPIELSPALKRLLEYIPMRNAAERAASQFFNTILWDFAKLHGLDHQDRITNWFANLIASNAIIAVQRDGKWIELNDIETGTTTSWITDGGTKHKTARRDPELAAIREDRLAKFFDDMHAAVSANPDFYRVHRDWNERVDDVPLSREPNRENTFEWDPFDYGILARSVAGIDQRLSVIEANQRSKHMAVRKTKAATKKTSKPAKKKTAPKRKKAAAPKKKPTTKGTNGRGTH